MFDQLARLTPEIGAEGKARGVDTLVRNRAVKALDLKPDDSLLDLGCGTGRVIIAASPKIRWGYGVDISSVSIGIARERALAAGARNLLFGVGSIEQPSGEINIAAAGVNKIVMLWSLHHLPENLQAESLQKLAGILRRPGRIVIGDLIFFEPPSAHAAIWDRVGYDGGLTDHPQTPEFLLRTLRRLGATVESSRLHPLAGVISAVWE